MKSNNHTTILKDSTKFVGSPGLQFTFIRTYEHITIIGYCSTAVYAQRHSLQVVASYMSSHHNYKMHVVRNYAISNGLCMRTALRV